MTAMKIRHFDGKIINTVLKSEVFSGLLIKKIAADNVEIEDGEKCLSAEN